MTRFEDEEHGFRSAVELMLGETLEGLSSSTRIFLQRPTRKNIERVADHSLSHLRALGIAIDQIFTQREDLDERIAMINTFADAAERERVRVINETVGFQLCEALPIAYSMTEENELVLSDHEAGPGRPIDVLGEVDTDGFSEEDLCKLIKEQVIGAYQGNIAADLVNLRSFMASRGMGRLIFWGERVGDHSADIAKVMAGGIAGYALAKTLSKNSKSD